MTLKDNSSSGTDRFDAIAPIDFAPSAGVTRRRGGLGRWLMVSVFAVLAALIAFAAYLFTGVSVLVAFEPAAAEVSLRGGWLNFKLSDRWLLHPGMFTVTANHPGYRDFSQDIVVERSADQEFHFSLVKLPGYLNLTTDPPTTAGVWVDGKATASIPWKRREMEAGVYPIVIRAPRYQDFVETVEITGLEQEQTIVASLVPNWADVGLSSMPFGATLYVDDEPYGETPLTAQILAGTHRLELRLEGYKSWLSELTVEANQGLTLPAVTLAQSDTMVAVASVPAGASVTVDGEYRGQTPMQLALSPGQRYRIGFAKAGYRPNHRDLDVVRGDEVRLQVRLQAILGEVLVVGTPDDAELFIDGAARGLINQRLELPAHPHRVEVRREGYETFSTTVTPNPDLDQQVSAILMSFEDIQRARTPDVLTADNGYRLKLVTPAGIFRMGSSRREQGRRSNEFIHQVQLQRRFYIGLYELSNQEFSEFDASHDSGIFDRYTLSLKKQPVVRVNWDQAARFCNWLSARDGLPPAYREQEERMVPIMPMGIGYRLPSEAEWDYVARYEGRSEGRAARKYPWGDVMPPQGGNYAGAEATSLIPRVIDGYRDEHVGTAQVGAYPPNGLGLFDIGGNVAEWIHDFYVIRAGQPGVIPIDPLGPDVGETHVLRGSDWRSGSITELRLTYRGESIDGGQAIGFRIARYAE